MLHTDLAHWPAICRRFGVSGEQETALVRDYVLAQSDSVYYHAMYRATRERVNKLFDEKEAIRKELEEFDAVMPARVAERVADNLDLAAVYRSLILQRLHLKTRIFECKSRIADQQKMAMCDEQLMEDADKAEHTIFEYYVQARCRYQHEQTIDTCKRYFMSNGYKYAENGQLGLSSASFALARKMDYGKRFIVPHANTLPRYSPVSARRRDCE